MEGPGPEGHPGGEPQRVRAQPYDLVPLLAEAQRASSKKNPPAVNLRKGIFFKGKTTTMQSLKIR